MKTTPKDDTAELLTIDDHTVRISHPEKLYFSRETQLTKLDLVRYYLAIAPGALQGIRDRPIVLKRFVNGACLTDSQPEPFYQKRAPSDLPAFLRTVTLSFPSGRTAEEVVVDNPAGLAFIVNLGCIELHPHPVRAIDPLEQNMAHPDELRIDLDPGPGVTWPDVRAVALEVKTILEENGLTGWPKTSGSRGMHVNVRIHPRWTFTEVRRAALALARAVERRVPSPRQLQMVERRTPRRLPRLQPERQGPHHRQRLLRPPAPRRPRLRPAPLARSPRRQPRRLHRPHHAPPLRRTRQPTRSHGRRLRLT